MCVCIYYICGNKPLQLIFALHLHNQHQTPLTVLLHCEFFLLDVKMERELKQIKTCKPKQLNKTYSSRMNFSTYMQLSSRGWQESRGPLLQRNKSWLRVVTATTDILLSNLTLNVILTLQNI